MPTNVIDIIRKLSPVQRKKVKSRAAELAAHEMTLQEEERYRSDISSESRTPPAERE